MTTALLLSGAGARGLIQSGMLFAVIDSGLKVDAVYGTSVGSMHGCLYQQGAPRKEIEDIWLNIKSSVVYKSGLLDAYRAITQQCLYDSSPLLALLRKTIGYETIFSNPRPFKIAATNMDTREPTIREASSFSTSKDFIDFIFASSSPPIFFPPVIINGEAWQDGGLTSNFNIAQAVKDGHDTLIILRPQPLYLAGRPKSIIDTVGLAIGIATEKYLERELGFVEFVNKVEDEKYKQIKIVYVTHQNYGIGLLDFDYKGLDRKKIIAESYNDAKIVLDKAFSV